MPIYLMTYVSDYFLFATKRILFKKPIFLNCKTHCLKKKNQKRSPMQIRKLNSAQVTFAMVASMTMNNKQIAITNRIVVENRTRAPPNEFKFLLR